MLIATFGPSTAWNGKTITYETGTFTLEGHGPVTAQAVLDYATDGHLIWASEATRELVKAQAQRSPAPIASGTEWRETRKWLGTPTQLVILAVLVVVMIGAWVVVSSMTRDEGVVITPIAPAAGSDDAAAREAAVREGVHSLQIGVQSWAVDHADAYPDVSLLNDADMLDYVGVWPTNPYTGLPMDQGSGPGQFAYERPSEYEYTITAYGEGGAVLITVP